VGAVRDLADAYVDQYAALDPIWATSRGELGHDAELTDYSPDGAAARADLARSTLAAAEAAEAEEEAERLCAKLLRDRLRAATALYDAGDWLRSLRVIGSPVGAIRSVFDLMPRATVEDWDQVARRLEAVPAAYSGLSVTLREGQRRGVMAAPRQANACAEQLETWSGQAGPRAFFAGYVSGAPDALRDRLEVAATAAAEAQAELGRYLRTEYAPASTQADAVGRERYPAYVREFLGAELDLDEAYQWAWDELARIEGEMRSMADALKPGASIGEAMDELDLHGDAVDGEAALQRWLQDLLDASVDALDGKYFELAAPLRKVEAMIAPPGGAAAQYYTPPSADFGRPGRTWYPTLGRTRFPLWGEWSTCYHEGVPGHHLQLAQWRYVAPQQSRFQTTAGISGNVEGWALYAERLMDEFGFLDEPGRRLGYLVAQQLRATRVVIDIGMHCEMPLPEGQPWHPGERMTPELGREFLFVHSGKDREWLASEYVRYLGWPAQAICYKLGERVWLAGRNAARRARGEAFDLKAWHMAALSQGSLGLDDLAAELAGL
jgi:uncharacterized protein (DUF885 family)